MALRLVGLACLPPADGAGKFAVQGPGAEGARLTLGYASRVGQLINTTGTKAS